MLLDPEWKAFWLTFGTIAIQHIIPLTMLGSLGWMTAWLLRGSTKQPDFQVADFFRDETGRASMGRLTAMGAFVIHSWAFSVWVMKGTVDNTDTLTYVGAWAGVLLTLRGMDVIRSVKLNVVPTGMTTPPLANPPPPGEPQENPPPPPPPKE